MLPSRNYRNTAARFKFIVNKKYKLYQPSCKILYHHFGDETEYSTLSAILWEYVFTVTANMHIVFVRSMAESLWFTKQRSSKIGAAETNGITRKQRPKCLRGQNWKFRRCHSKFKFSLSTPRIVAAARDRFPDKLIAKQKSEDARLWLLYYICDSIESESF